MPSDRQPPKEYRASQKRPRLSYSEKLLDPRWQRKRLEVFNAAGWRCQECNADDQTLHVHHIFYVSCLEPWDAPPELLLCLCKYHHEERQAVEQVIFVEVAKHLATLNVSEMRRQPIFAFFQDDSTLDYFPAWQRDYLRHERDRD